MTKVYFFSAVAACSLLISTPGHTQVSPIQGVEQQHSTTSSEPSLPFREVVPYEEDRKVVRVFFTFDCEFSYMYDNAIWDWSRNLPNNWTVEFTPVLTTDQASFNGLKVFQAVAKADPVRLQQFMSQAFMSLQKGKMSPMNEQTWVEIVKSSGVDFERFITAWNSLEDSEKLISSTVDQVSHYGVEVTPTVTIDGRYVITPENTNGNSELFMQLLNGMVSKAEGYA